MTPPVRIPMRDAINLSPSMNFEIHLHMFRVPLRPGEPRSVFFIALSIAEASGRSQQVHRFPQHHALFPMNLSPGFPKKSVAPFPLDVFRASRHTFPMQTHCARCRAPMTCQPEGGCWCGELPHLPMPAEGESKDCLCRACLLEKIKTAGTSSANGPNTSST